MRTSSRRLLSLLLTTLLILSALTGCAKPDPAPSAPADAAAVQPTADPALFDGATPIPAPAQPAFAEGGDVTVAMPEVSPEPVVDELAGLNDTQRNSINMLNHLVVLTTEMNTNRNNRAYLEEMYSEVLNNFNPEMVDETTQGHIVNLLNDIERYRIVNVKRDRMQFLLEKNKASAYRAAVPSPLALLNVVQSGSPLKMLVSATHLVVDSITNYSAATDAAELEFIQNNWELEDAADKVLHDARTAAFNYMTTIVRDNNLPGLLTLNDASVVEFVKIADYSNNLQIIQSLVSKQDIYKAYGEYWLTLAKCYYKNNDYAKCLEALASYEALNVRLFRKDYEYARTLPFAISAAGEILTGEEYVMKVASYADAIRKNTGSKDWSLRYFAAQTYITLAGLTGNQEYLEAAYDIALNNVNELVIDQKQMNAEYIAELAEEKPAKDATDEQKDDIKAYNKLRKEERKTEMAPLSEPLLLNCDLLFALAEELNKDQSAKELINGILHENGEPIFLVTPIDKLYYYGDEQPSVDAACEKAAFDGKRLVLPVSLVSNTGTIRATVTSGEDSVVIEDWKLQEVERGEKENIKTFTAVYASETAKRFKYAADSVVTVEVTPRAGSNAEVLTFAWNVVSDKTLLVIPSTHFEKVDK